MTKAEALSEFKEHVLPSVIEIYGENDKIAIRTEWNDYVDYLHKEGRITDNQVESWDNPFG